MLQKVRNILTSVSLLILLSVVPDLPASANQGSAFGSPGAARVCGYTATSPKDGFIGLVYLDLTSDGFSPSRECLSALVMAEMRIKGDPELVGLNWTQHTLASCTSVGEILTPAWPMKMCLKMGPNKTYKILWLRETGKTTFEPRSTITWIE